MLKFDQSPWLKQYIDFNTEKRKHAKNLFEKDFFKLMNNSVFRKTMENLRKQVDVRLVTNEKKLDKLTSKPTYVSSKIFNENLMAVHKVKETLTLNRPAYVGMCILDLSKTLMYDFHYNYIKKKHNNRARLLFINTDSLTYQIEAEDVYNDFWNDKDMFDNSDYPESSPYYCNANKKIIGKFNSKSKQRLSLIFAEGLGPWACGPAVELKSPSPALGNMETSLGARISALLARTISMTNAWYKGKLCWYPPC